MARDTIRAVRLVYLYDLLKQGPHTIQGLAVLCDVSPETVARDLVDLQLAPMSVRVRALDGRWTIAGECDG
jgi:DeoR/GlpR family transcriptional regulator of sugar metabolism